jgi:ribose/xylose/arabinose/galactoside ABC-type transport system permease subunit
LSGGRGSVLGTVLAAFLVSMLIGVLFASGVSTFYQSVFQGGILLAVLMFGNVGILRANSWMRLVAAD